VKHFLHRRSPEYCRKKKAERVLQQVQILGSIAFDCLHK
jgi:hypothetical protein